MADPLLRISIPASGQSTAVTVTTDASRPYVSNVIPAKEWAVTDDILNVSDSASFTVSNEDGINTGKFRIGQLVLLEESDSDVANGQWRRIFTGRIVRLQSHSDVSGGSNILVSCQDLGWHLTNCHGSPLRNLRGVKFLQLIQVGGLLIDSTWGFNPTLITDGNSHNRTLKQGRRGAVIALQPKLGERLPVIQVEPGQTPWDILREYATREGLLINVSVDGRLVLFRPQYSNAMDHRIEYHPSNDSRSAMNNVTDSPSATESIDGLYSRVECWSTLVLPLEATGFGNADNPNEDRTHFVFQPSVNPLPFFRRHVFNDSEAINATMGKNRAHWKHDMDLFNSFIYEATFDAHSQNGVSFSSDSMIGINDTVNGVSGPHYVASVQRSYTLREGTKAKLTIRKPRLLNPELTEQTGRAALYPAVRQLANVAAAQSQASVVTVIKP